MTWFCCFEFISSQNCQKFIEIEQNILFFLLRILGNHFDKKIKNPKNTIWNWTQPFHWNRSNLMNVLQLNKHMQFNDIATCFLGDFFFNQLHASWQQWNTKNSFYIKINLNFDFKYWLFITCFHSNIPE